MFWKLVALLLFVMLAGLQYRLWLGPGSLQEKARLQAMMAAQEEENSRLKARNAELAEEVADLKQGQQAVEELARQELGMIKPNETFYQLTE